MKQLKAEQKGEVLQAKRINTHVSSGYCGWSTFAYADISDLLKMYGGKDCQIYFEILIIAVAFVLPQQGMKRHTEKVKREHKTAKYVRSFFKQLHDYKNVWDQCP